MSRAPTPPVAVPQVPAPSVPLTGYRVDLSRAQTMYVNYCRVTAMPEDLVIDFALQTDVSHGFGNPMMAAQRITLSQFTAKRLLEALQATMARYEASFGNVEPAPDKRYRGPKA